MKFDEGMKKMKEGEGGEQCAGSLKTRGMHLRVK